MKYTAQQLLHSISKNDKDSHTSLKVNKYDRDYYYSSAKFYRDSTNNFGMLQQGR